MALTPSGAISMADLNTALGRSSTAAISLNDTQVRFISAAYSGAINMNGLRNKYTWNGTLTVRYTPQKGYDEYGYDAANQAYSATGTLLNRRIIYWRSTSDGGNSIVTEFGAAPTPNPPPTGSFRARTGTTGNVKTGTFSYSGGGAETYLNLTGDGFVFLVTYEQTLLAQPLTWQVSSA